MLSRDAGSRMTSHNTTEQEDPTLELPPTDSESDVDVNEDAPSDWDEEEEMKKWLSTTYEPGSRSPMKEPLTAPWDLSISDADVEKLKVGFKPHSMDDKWDILVENPDKDGNLSIHIIRSWLQEECYILHIAPKQSSDDGGGEGGGGGAKVQGITWEGNKAGLQCDAQQAKKEAVMLARSLLQCEFEKLPHYPSSVFWDPNAYKKLDVK